MLLVDIDGALGKPTNNKALIESFGRNNCINFYAVGGGIRSLDAANSYLSHFEHVVISSNLGVINDIPKETRSKIIV